MDFQLKILSAILFKKIDSLIQENILQGKKIILFGLNSTSYSIKNYLEQEGFDVYAYVDNNAKRVAQVKDGGNKTIPAYLPDEVLLRYNKEFIILIASKYYDSMCRQLKNMGYEEHKNIIQIVDFYSIDNVIKAEESIEQEGQEIDEIRPIQLEILKYVKEVCEKNQLRYYLAAGTLLGAIRHKGYIPWDDDIDLIMPLKDYKKLIEILKKETRFIPFEICSHPETCYKFYLRVVDSQTNLKSWDFPFLTTSGVSIDIFPLSGVPGDDREKFEFMNEIAEKKTDYLSTFIEYTDPSEETLKRRIKLREDILEMIARYDFDNSEVVGNPVSKIRERETAPRVAFDKTVEVEFEGVLYKAPEGYDTYLHNMYGDYMKLPPVEERATTHNYRVYKML